MNFNYQIAVGAVIPPSPTAWATTTAPSPMTAPARPTMAPASATTTAASATSLQFVELRTVAIPATAGVGPVIVAAAPAAATAALATACKTEVCTEFSFSGR